MTGNQDCQLGCEVGGPQEAQTPGGMTMTVPKSRRDHQKLARPRARGIVGVKPPTSRENFPDKIFLNVSGVRGVI